MSRREKIMDHLTVQAKEEFAVRHYSVAEIAQLWGVSAKTVQRIFQNEPDVLILGSRFRGSRRVRQTLRIPAYVVDRVHRNKSVGGTSG
jgi:hypothetical protein